MRPEDAMAMQVRCLNCLREQYALAVLEISLDRQPCVWCAWTTEPMTVAQYRAALRVARVRRAESPAT